ncbi:multidrug efflux SMR transporter [uncultured Selenomonas sp.]|uniref:DMT family transporter n=1 Tax=uncultured Selenomonas sp. TaxID=159275 RepID=UPI0025D82F74|nr:multidrug efflux SMR transporter [uncultured Selenomonas sp.]
MTGYVYLMLAIVGELLGTTLLKYSDGFSRLGIGVLSLLFYGICFWLLSKALQMIHLGVAYALWSGIGIVATTLIGILFWQEILTGAGVLGIALILAGIVILNLFGAAA